MKTYRIRKTRKVRSAFTLMEVLLVLAILGVLMALVVPRLIQQLPSSQIKATRISISGLEQALGFYALDHDGNYPYTSEGLAVLIQPSSNDDKSWNGPYLEETQTLPLDAWQNEIQYQYPSQNQPNGVGADLWSFGPDGQDGTGDEITNWELELDR